VNGSRKEHLQIRLRKRRLIRTHSCGAIILPVSPVRHNGRRDLLLTLASTSSSGSLSSATPIPKRSPSDLDGIDLMGALGANGRSFSPSITVRLCGQPLQSRFSSSDSLYLFQVLWRVVVVGIIGQDLKLIARTIVLHTGGIS
jgi:hypothetical protein